MVTGWETGSVQQPSEQEGPIWVRRKGDRIEDDSGCDATLLVEGDVRALQAGPHATSAETSLSDLPHPIYDRIEYEIVVGSAETQATSGRQVMRTSRWHQMLELTAQHSFQIDLTAEEASRDAGSVR